MERTVIIDNTSYKYNLRKSKKARYIRLKVSSSGAIELVLPSFAPYSEGVKFLEAKTEWLKKQLNKSVKRVFTPKYLGNEIDINQQFDFFNSKYFVRFEVDTLSLSNYNNKQDIEDRFYTWLRQKAKEYIPVRVKQIAGELGISYGKVTIRNQKTRWGSCSAKGNLSFNLKLMMYEKRVIDYVIIHELCHRKEMNHSKRFWNLVENYMPDYRVFKKQLTNSN